MTNRQPEPTGSEYELVDRLIEENLFRELAEFVAVPTHRGGGMTEAEVVANLEKLRDSLLRQTRDFNQGQTNHQLTPFEWKQPIPGEERAYWLFGLRLGNGPYKIAVSSHLDTVPPGEIPDWEPFRLKREYRDYLGLPDQEFYVGRGSIDDKGPAIVAFNVLKAIAQEYDGSALLDEITLELLFDTSEETDMAMPHYLRAKKEDTNPDFGLIYDASWSIRAEKGIERPVFTVMRGDTGGAATRAAGAPGSLWIQDLRTPQGPTNQIPDSAEAVICGSSPDQLARFAETVAQAYHQYGFDDAEYHRAALTVDRTGMPGRIKLVTEVAGAQHGSAPNENREGGANPLVSLANFLAGLVGQGVLDANEIGCMCRFIEWTWGTRVFGENHPELLERYDQVFSQGNGTTYGVTRMYSNPDPETAVRLEVDIRYAMGHHPAAWDGSEGMLPGDKSIFQGVFQKLADGFNAGSAHPVSFSTSTAVPPDIRLPQGPSFSKVSRAYERVMGCPTPARAIGGGTDAKGHNELVAAGALFTESLGPPINFHGFNEGAPVEDLRRGARIIYRLFVDEIESLRK